MRYFELVTTGIEHERFEQGSVGIVLNLFDDALVGSDDHDASFLRARVGRHGVANVYESEVAIF